MSETVDLLAQVAFSSCSDLFNMSPQLVALMSLENHPFYVSRKHCKTLSSKIWHHAALLTVTRFHSEVWFENHSCHPIVNYYCNKLWRASSVPCQAAVPLPPPWEPIRRPATLCPGSVVVCFDDLLWLGNSLQGL